MDTPRSMDSPFRPGFGKNPPFLAGRDQVMERLRRSIELGQWPQERGTLITGLRGVGKTVLLNHAEDFASDSNWEVVSETASPGFFERIVGVHLPEIINRLAPTSGFRVTGVSVAGVGSIEVEYPDGRRETPTYRNMAKTILDLKGGNGGLLFSVDEVTDAGTEELAQFAGEYQHLVREDHEVAFIGAGVKGEINHILASRSATFLRRCANIEIGLLSYEETLEAFRVPIRDAGRLVTEDVLEYMARASQGYPFLVQSIGDLAWRRSSDHDQISIDDAGHGYRYARRSMGDFIHEPALSNLSPKDRSFLIAMVHDEGPSKIEDIRQRMGGIKSGYAGMYRERLIKAGLIRSSSHGYVEISFPYLKQYLKTHIVAEAAGDQSRGTFPAPPPLN